MVRSVNLYSSVPAGSKRRCIRPPINAFLTPVSRSAIEMDSFRIDTLSPHLAYCLDLSLSISDFNWTISSCSLAIISFDCIASTFAEYASFALVRPHFFLFGHADGLHSSIKHFSCSSLFFGRLAPRFYRLIHGFDCLVPLQAGMAPKHRSQNEQN